MIIGVDAGALSMSDDRLKVGVWRVVDNLVRELLVQDKKNTYRLYSFRPLEAGGQNVVLPQKGWFKAWLPLELARNPVDCFLGLSQALPSFAPKNSIGFIYDLGFLHFPQNYSGSYRALKKQTEDLVRRARRIVTISETCAADIIATYGVPKEKITVAYPGISAVFRTQKRPFRSKIPYVLFVGALKRGKNIPVLLEAFAKFLSQTKALYDLYLVGGNYWFDSAIDETICRLSLRNRVKFPGVVSDDQLAALYRGATALVAPSLWEGFCLPVAEAMASGCPVITSDAGALPEIVGDAGILVNPHDSDGFAQAMRRVIADTVFRQKGRKRARLFSWQTMAEALLCDIRQ